MLPDTTVRRLRFERAIAWTTAVLFSLSCLAVLLLAATAFAQPVATSSATMPQPAWLTLALGLAPWVVALVTSLHFGHHAGAWLRSDAAKRSGAIGKLELVLADGADELDDYLEQNKQSVQDLADPTKRAAAEAALKAAGVADAKAAVDSALKRALQNG